MTSFPIAHSKMAKLINEKDWSRTSLGPIETWPQSLRTALGIALDSRFPIFMTWGPERISFYNDAYIPVLGDKHPNSLGKGFHIIWADIWNDVGPLAEQVDRGESVFLEDLVLVMNRYGYDEKTYFTFSYSPIRDEQGKVGGLFCACMETTKAVKAVADIKTESANALDKEQALRFALAAGHMGAWTVDLKTSAVKMSKEAIQIFGIDETDSAVDPIIETAIHPDDQAKAKHDLETAIVNKSLYNSEYRVIRPRDGAQRWVLATGQARVDTNGTPFQFAGVVVDITDRREAEQELAQSAKVITDVLENTNDGFFSVDRNWIIKNVNSNHEKFTQLKRDQQIGKNLLELFFSAPEYRESQYWKSYHKAMDERVPVVFEDYYPPLDLWTSVSVYPQPDGGLAVFFRKTNEEKRVARSLVEAKEEAERANHLKSAFLANMSHEIRTPLGAMLGFADLLRDPGLTATERTNFIDILSRNGESLAVIINDILDLSKVESGHLSVEYTDTYPDKVAADVVSLLRVSAKEKDLTLEYEHDASCPKRVTSDPTRVRQILLNLVSNAIKFTRFGSVKIRAYGCHTDDGRPAVCIEVKDTGMGIPSVQQSQIFEMFVQADGTMTRRFGGTGLGLSLSRSLARALGGDVSLIESREGFGSTFLIKIEDRPDKYQETTVRTALKSSIDDVKEGALKDVRVLVVDDAPDNQQLIWRYLTKQGAHVESAENGLVGYRTALHGSFDVVLMDIQMPVMDGYTATSKLREAGYRKPIIALTAHAMTDVRKKALNVGYDDHLPKPINPRDLISTIVRYVNESKTTEHHRN